MRDISVDESEQIPAILDQLTSGPLADAALAGGGAPAAPADAERLRAALAAATPSVARLRQLCELMDARLAEIRRRWDGGVLSAAGLSANDVCGLVCALFEDTPPRRDLLRHLQHAN
jgi:hypothetical protein